MADAPMELIGYREGDMAPVYLAEAPFFAEPGVYVFDPSTQAHVKVIPMIKEPIHGSRT